MQPSPPRPPGGVRADSGPPGLRSSDIVVVSGPVAGYLPRLPPTAMIFVPCAAAIGHNEIEDARPEHLEAGCNVLLHSMLRSAGVAA